MRLTFLSADVPLVKSFTLVNGSVVKTPYPNAFFFTSHSEEISSLVELHDAIVAHSKKGNCLLKGDIKRELKRESRAGSTDSESGTQWLCLDVDGLSGIGTPDEFMAAVGLADVSYVIQHSASAGINGDSTLRCHIFVLLTGSVPATFIKQWLMHLNLNTPSLRDELALTRTGNALRWPLDITTCQNDKLIYIGLPKIGTGVECSFKGKRVELVKKKLPALPTGRITADVHKVRKDAKDVLNHLRKEAGYTSIKDTQYKVKNNVSYLAKPGEAVITGIKQDRGFIYFNLNGGDSWAYYHPENNAEFIYNFKGEPAYRTEELLPEYWKSLRPAASQETKEREYFVLRDFKTDRLYNGYYEAVSDEVVLAKAANEGRLRSFLKQHGLPVPDFIPDWDLKYDPSSNKRYDPENKVINLYRPSPFYALSAQPVRDVPKTIRKVIESAVGTGDVYEHFINWLAYIVQFRKMTKTAWVLHGNQGTGKGVLFNKIITPMLGGSNVTSILMAQLESSFNSYLEHSLVVFVDEVQISKLTKAGQVSGDLKSYIVEPTVNIRNMYSEARRVPNFSNWIFASNTPDPVAIEVTDRRHNVGMFQKTRLELTQAEFAAVDNEVTSFFFYLLAYKVDEYKAQNVLDTDDRKLLISINRTSVDEIADALLHGDLQWLVDQLPSSQDPVFNTPAAAAYRSLIEQMIAHGRYWKNISRDEMFIVFDYCVGNVPRSPHKFTSMLKHHRIYTKKVRRDDNTFYGLTVEWKQDDAWFSEAFKKYCAREATKVVSIKKAKTA